VPQAKLEQIAIQAKIEDDSVFDDISHISERNSRPVDLALPMHLQNQEFLPVQQLQRDEDFEVKSNLKSRRAELKKQRGQAQESGPMKEDDNRPQPQQDQMVSAKDGEESIPDGLTVRTVMPSAKRS
jgi:hypothetical protein